MEIDRKIGQVPAVIRSIADTAAAAREAGETFQTQAGRLENLCETIG